MLAALVTMAAVLAGGQPKPEPNIWGSVRSLGKADGNLYTISPDGSEMVFRPWAKAVTVLDLKTGKTRRIPGQFGGHFGSISYSPDGKFVACAEWQNGATIRDAKTWEVVQHVTPGGKHPVSTAVFLPDSKRVAFYCWWFNAGFANGVDRGTAVKHHDYQIALWDVENKKELGHPAAERMGLPALHFHEGPFVGRPFLCIREDSSDDKGYSALKMFSMTDMVTNKTTPRILLHKDDDRAFDVTPDGKQILVMTAGKDPQFVDVQTGARGRSFGGHTRLVTVAALSRDGKRVVTASGRQVDGFTAAKLKAWPPNVGPTELKIHDAETGEVIATHKSETLADFLYVGFSPDGKYVWAQTHDKELWVWGRFPRASDWIEVNWPVDPPPAKPAAVARPGPVVPLDVPLADALDKLVESLPSSGKPVAQQIDAVFLASLGRFPTAAETKRFQELLGAKPTADRLRALLATITASPEFDAHVKTLQKRVPAPQPFNWGGGPQGFQNFPFGVAPFGSGPLPGGFPKP